MNPSTLPAPPLAEVYDVAVIGGWINGVGIAADAAGRGLSVFLCEKDDLASHTSSASSNADAIDPAANYGNVIDFGKRWSRQGGRVHRLASRSFRLGIRTLMFICENGS